MVYLNTQKVTVGHLGGCQLLNLSIVKVLCMVQKQPGWVQTHTWINTKVKKERSRAKKDAKDASCCLWFLCVHTHPVEGRRPSTMVQCPCGPCIRCGKTELSRWVHGALSAVLHLKPCNPLFRTLSTLPVCAQHFTAGHDVRAFDGKMKRLTKSLQQKQQEMSAMLQSI